ncbi:Bacterial type II secretion system protein F domain protein [Neorhodopirellula pilleata]|uniref:Bacterial type II secretion system protein F domain protein n=2 Tax=Neorhodopirellula pilleata TaxID=2714738 RepID=A0A5C6AUL0_9BACT|nr:Bacterial type II secretion system protein F domain protein [Neorhodopirellula pilleata]
MLLFLACLSIAAATFLTIFSLGPTWDLVTGRYLADIKPKLRRLNIDDSALDRYMRWWGVTLVGSFVVLGIIMQMIPIALFVGFVIFVSPRYFLDYMLDRRRSMLRDQLVRASVGVANGCRAGLGLPQAIEKVAFDTPEPLSLELKRISRDYRAGRPLQDAIREVQKRLDIESFTTFSSAIIVTLQKGGNISTSLERISRGLEEIQRLERKVEADTAAGKRMAVILSLFPIGFLGMFYVLDPVSTGVLFETFVGQLVVFTVLAIVYVAWKWCLSILDLDL